MSIANLEGVETASPVATRQMRNAIVASVLGWSLDLFDLFILLYVAPVVGALFFPSSVPTLSLAAVYASFAVTLLMRPVGSAIFGHYADVHGRKNAMFVAIVGVGVSTAAFGLLPTIAQVGFIAPVLFLALRLVQGVFVGGVVASTHTIGTEWVVAELARGHVRPCRRRWRGNWGAAGLVRLPGDVFDLSRRSVRGVGMAVHVLRRASEFAARLVHLQQSRGIAVLQGAAEAEGRRYDYGDGISR